MNLDEQRQIKERGSSVKEVLQATMNNVDNIDSVEIIMIEKNGYINHSISTSNSLELLGAVKILELEIADAITEYE